MALVTQTLQNLVIFLPFLCRGHAARYLHHSLLGINIQKEKKVLELLVVKQEENPYIQLVSRDRRIESGAILLVDIANFKWWLNHTVSSLGCK